MHAGEFGSNLSCQAIKASVLHARGGVWGKGGERNLKLSCSPCTRGSLEPLVLYHGSPRVFSMHAGEFGKKGGTQFETFVFSMHAGEFGQHGSRDLELRCVLHARGGVWQPLDILERHLMCSPCTRGSLGRGCGRNQPQNRVLHARGGVWISSLSDNNDRACSPCTRGSLAVDTLDWAIIFVFSMHAGEFG